VYRGSEPSISSSKSGLKAYIPDVTRYEQPGLRASRQRDVTTRRNPSKDSAVMTGGGVDAVQVATALDARCKLNSPPGRNRLGCRRYRRGKKFIILHLLYAPPACRRAEQFRLVAKRMAGAPMR